MIPEPQTVDVGRPHSEGVVEPVTTLGIDIGSTNTKVVLVAIESTTIYEVSVRSFPTPDDAVDLLAAVDAGISAVMDGVGCGPQVIGVASMAETGVPLNADGAPLTELLRWNQRQSVVGADDLAALAGAAGLFAATGVQPGPKAPLALWAGLRLRDAALWQRMRRWAGTADLVVQSLTGKLVTDHTLAGRTMAYRLPHSNQPLSTSFDAVLLSLVGLRPGQLPAVARPGTAAGTLTAAAARRLHLRVGTPVVVAGHDHAVGAWAAGVRMPGDAADSLGTAEALVRVLGGPLDRCDVAASGMSLTRTIEGDRESLVAATPHAGALIGDWFRTVLAGVGRTRADCAGVDCAGVFADVHARGTVVGDLLVLPYPSGRPSPAPDRCARLRILDRQGRDVDPATRSATDLTHALLTGMSLHLRWMDAEQRRLIGTAPAIVGVLGAAGAANQAWLDLKTAVMPVPLALVDAAQPVATGAALLAAARLGLVEPGLSLPHRPLESRSAGSAPGSAPGADYDEVFTGFIAAATDAAPAKGPQ
ncbi:MAG: Xylulokinase [Microbacteriaceae bacterium]|nr:Xylulokinase [Microbacteriaceae bacterium]